MYSGDARRRLPVRAPLIAPLLAFTLFAAVARGEQFTLPSELTLSQAVEAALARHPALQAAEARLRGTSGLQTQAALRPNPALFVQTENWRFAGDPGFRP